MIRNKKSTVIRASIGAGGLLTGIMVALSVFAGVTQFWSTEVVNYDNGDVEAATEVLHSADELPEIDVDDEIILEEVEPVDSSKEDIAPATGESVTIGGGTYAFRVPSGYRLANELVARDGGVVTSVTVTKGSTQQIRDYNVLVGDGAHAEGGDGIPPFMPGQSITVSLARIGEREADMELAQNVSNVITTEGYNATYLERVSGANTSDVTYVEIEDTLIAVRMYHTSEFDFDRASYDALIATVRKNS